VKFHSEEHLEQIIEELRALIERGGSETTLAFLLRDFDWVAELARLAWNKGEGEK